MIFMAKLTKLNDTAIRNGVMELDVQMHWLDAENFGVDKSINFMRQKKNHKNEYNIYVKCIVRTHQPFNKTNDNWSIHLLCILHAIYDKNGFLFESFIQNEYTYTIWNAFFLFPFRRAIFRKMSRKKKKQKQRIFCRFGHALTCKPLVLRA